jgi:uncharacterized protein YggU (UPF0235/DUF167 family)
VPSPTTRLRLRVSPGASRSEIVGRRGDSWHVRVTVAPERGRANEAVLRLLADRLGVAKSRLSVVSGHVGRDNVVQLDGVDTAEAERLLAQRA